MLMSFLGLENKEIFTFAIHLQRHLILLPPPVHLGKPKCKFFRAKKIFENYFKTKMFNRQNRRIGMILSIFLVSSFLVKYSECVPTREILNSNREREEKTEEVQMDPKSESILNLITAIPTALIATIQNLTSDASSGLGSLFMKPSGGGGGSGPIFSFNKNGTVSSCNPIDPLLLANIPGVFIAVPVVLFGIALLIAIIAVIVIAIMELGGMVTKNAYDSKFADQGMGGYAPSVMPVYGSPVSSSYGTPPADSAYSRLSQNVDTATNDFNAAYDKYSSLMAQSQPQQLPQSQPSTSSYPAYSADNDWRNNIVMKRMKQ